MDTGELTCGCRPPHRLCATGEALQAAAFGTYAAVDEALRRGDGPALEVARRERARAERAYLEHIGYSAPGPSLLDLAYQRLLGPRGGWPAERAIILAELRRLYRAAGEPLPSSLEAV